MLFNNQPSFAEEADGQIKNDLNPIMSVVANTPKSILLE
jgi:hypothetical protein